MWTYLSSRLATAASTAAIPSSCSTRPIFPSSCRVLSSLTSTSSLRWVMSLVFQQPLTASFSRTTWVSQYQKNTRSSANIVGPFEHTMPIEILSKSEQCTKNSTEKVCNKWMIFNDIEGYWCWCRSIGSVWFPVSFHYNCVFVLYRFWGICTYLPKKIRRSRDTDHCDIEGSPSQSVVGWRKK